MFTYSFDIPAQFRGKVKATATDNAGNVTGNETISDKAIVVDTDIPGLEVDYPDAVNKVNDVNYYSDNVTVTFIVNEENFMDGEFKGNVNDFVANVIIRNDKNNYIYGTDDQGQPMPKRYPIDNWERDKETNKWIGSITLEEEGDYTLDISYADKSKNAVSYTNANYQFTIDKTVPKVKVDFDSIKPIHTIDEREYYNTNRSAVITVTEHNFFPEYFETKNILKAQNILGDEVTNYIKYFKDSKNWTTDSTGNVHTIKVDFKSDANYSFDFEFEDLAKNKCADYKEYRFTVDKTAPKNLKTFTNELDKAYANDSVEIVVHELNVDQVNISNDSDEETVFALHDGTSTGYVTLQEGSGSNGNYVKNTLRGEGGWYETRYTLSNDNFAHDGVYSFSILSYDRAGNSNLNTKDDTGVIKFTVDRTNPVITSNISTNQVIDADSHTVEFEINDTNHDKNTVEVTLNGKPVPNESITSLGGNSYSFEMSTGSKQSVSVTSKDLAGNTADQYEINDVTVSTNQFVLFYYSHTLLFWIIVAGIVLLALLILFIVFRRKKDDDEDEEKA